MSGSDRFDNALRELDHLHGLISVRQQIKQVLVDHDTNLQQLGRGNAARASGMNMILVGPGGVGKAEVALALGDVLRSCGMLKKGHVVFTHFSDFIAHYGGLSTTKTQDMCNEALDGVLFIDDSYMFQRRDKNVQEVVDAMTAFMTANNGRIAVILEAYPNEMRKFVTARPDFLGHFNRIEFPPYTIAELLEILRRHADRRNMVLPVGLDKALTPWLEQRMVPAIQTDSWYNGTEVCQLLRRAIEVHAKRTGNVSLEDGHRYIRYAGSATETTRLEMMDFEAAMAR